MSDITGNPTPLNVPAAQDASGTLTPKQGSSATPPTAQAAIGAPVNVASTSAPPRAADNTSTPTPPGVPDMPYGDRAATLKRIDVTPPNDSIAVNATLQYTATGVYTSGPSKDLTSTVAWTTNNAALATFNPDGAGGGLVTGHGSGGDVIVSATLNGVSGTTGLTVTAS